MSVTNSSSVSTSSRTTALSRGISVGKSVWTCFSRRALLSFRRGVGSGLFARAGPPRLAVGFDLLRLLGGGLDRLVGFAGRVGSLAGDRALPPLRPDRHLVLGRRVVEQLRRPFFAPELQVTVKKVKQKLIQFNNRQSCCSSQSVPTQSCLEWQLFRLSKQ